MKKILLILFLSLPFLAQGQIITTIGGCGIGDDSLATSAELFYPHNVAVDSAGNLYIAEAKGNRVRKVVQGTITTVAGNGWSGYSGDGGMATVAVMCMSRMGITTA